MEPEFRPEDYGIPAGYRHWPGDTAEDHIGPFFFYMDGPHPRTAFRSRPEHGNTHHTIHGGVLATFADYTVCLGASGGEEESSATISLNTEFIAPAHVGKLLLGEGEVLRRGHSLVFMRVIVREEGKVILTASSVIKRLRKRH